MEVSLWQGARADARGGVAGAPSAEMQLHSLHFCGFDLGTIARAQANSHIRRCSKQIQRDEHTASLLIGLTNP